MIEEVIRAIVRDEIKKASPKTEEMKESCVDIRGFDPTGEGSAYQPEPAPGSDAEHPPVGHRLAKVGEKIARRGIVWERSVGPWADIGEESFAYSGDTVTADDPPIANPIPANEGDSRVTEPERVFVPVPSREWIPGFPPKPYAGEWFFAKLDNGGIVALTALPDEYSYDFETVDGTYFVKGCVVGWMQNPDSEYIAFGHEITTDEVGMNDPAEGKST